MSALVPEWRVQLQGASARYGSVRFMEPVMLVPLEGACECRSRVPRALWSGAGAGCGCRMPVPDMAMSALELGCWCHCKVPLLQ